MARRVVMGQMTDGSYDLRISRRGVDAMTADVNNPKQVSFSALRQATAKVASTGVIMSMGAWVSLGKTFDFPPPTLAVLKRGGRMYFNYYVYYTGAGAAFNWYYNPYCLVLQENRARISKTAFESTTLPSGDGMVWYMLEN
jgi:hypothetical protein